MIAMIRRLLAFSGSQKKNLVLSFVCSLIEAVFEMLPIVAVLTVLTGLLDALGGAAMPGSVIGVSLAIMVASIAGRIVFGSLSSARRTVGSFDFCAEKRLEIGESIKRAPMGYFSEHRLGDIAAAATTTLDDIENNAVSLLERVAGGFIFTLVIVAWLLAYEWRIGVIVVAGLAASMFVYALLQRAGKRLAPRRQAAQAGLVAAALEYVQGMGVVMAFGLGERSDRAIDAAIRESARTNTVLEATLSSLTAVYQTVFKIVAALLLAVVPYLLIGGAITTEACLLLLVASFVIYSKMELAGSMAAVARAIEASLDRLERVLDIPALDEGGREIEPERVDIRLEHVAFSYGADPVIRDVSLVIPQGSTCAIVGPSGSGKTTLCSLIARFWDVQEGSVSVGGHDVRDYTCDSLLANFTIVFQNVYLFEDTVEGNIRFGRPSATHEAVVEAAKRAYCHDFIMALPNGYDTVIGEGGASLSGGEKQRISIARALLKDAPIVILDEATASVDPENERELLAAITELTRDKTVIMIAHRLLTVRHADQIVVLDGGRIVQRGTHDELMGQDGLYRRFVDVRREALRWSL